MIPDLDINNVSEDLIVTNDNDSNKPTDKKRSKERGAGGDDVYGSKTEKHKKTKKESKDKEMKKKKKSSKIGLWL